MSNSEFIQKYTDEVVEEYFKGSKSLQEAFNTVKARYHLEVRAKLTTDIRNIQGLEEFMRNEG